LTYSLQRLTVAAQVRYYGPIKQSADPTLVFAIPEVPSSTFTDLTASYEFQVRNVSLAAFAGINNLFDKQPPLYSDPVIQTIPGFRYPVWGDSTDVVGRYFFAGVRFHL